MHASAIGYVGRRFALFLAVICVVLLALEAWHERDQRADQIQQTEAAALNVARAVAREADATFTLAGTVLFGIVERLQSGDRTPDALGRLSRSMALAVRNITSLSGLFVYDQDGRWIATSLDQIPPGVNNADRAYFQFHKSNPSLAPHLSEPIRSRSSGAWIMLVSRRLQRTDGSFAGVVAATVNVEHFVGRFSGFDVGTDGTIALLTREGRILARQPYVEVQIGRDLSASPLFQDDLPKGPSGVGRYVSPIDGGTRIAGFATASTFPVVAYAAVSEDEALASWRSGALVRVLSLTALLVALTVLGLKLLGVIRRRERAEIALAASEGRYRLLSAAATDMVTHMDLSGRRLYVSPASRDLLGYEPHELIDTSPQQAIHPDDAAGLARLLGDLTAGRRERGVNVNRLRHRDGRWVWVEASLQRLQDGAGRTTGFVASVRNIEARKADEAALLAARAEAERASAAKSEFLAAMSHEIRTPLNAVIGFSDLLSQDPQLGPRQRQHTERVRNAGAALLTVVNDILDFSKVEAGAMSIHPRPFSPAQLIDNAVSIVRGSAEHEGLRLAVDLNPNVPVRLVGDEDRLRQVLLNLLNNAIKFTRRGGVTLTVAGETAGSEAFVLRVHVRDTGIGIPEDQLGLLFQRFSQVESSHARGHGGTGLGLAISKRLVDLMGGEIGVESRAGVGSEFRFRVELPIAAAVTDGAVTGRPTGDLRAGRALRLLLVDDLELNRDLAGAILERVGHHVEFAVDGWDAVRVASGGRHDLILMDMQMPGMDGLEATRRIRALGTAAARVPIVAMTANVLPEQVAACRAAGMEGHIGKPFRHDELLAAIARHAAPADAPVAEGDGIVEAAPIDRAILADLRTVLGEARVDRLLAGLHGHLSERFGDALGELDADVLIADAHATISAAGQLGFALLAELCRQLEAAYRGGHRLPNLELRVRAAREQVLRLIEVERGVLRAA